MFDCRFMPLHGWRLTDLRWSLRALRTGSPALSILFGEFAGIARNPGFGPPGQPILLTLGGGPGTESLDDATVGRQAR
jgi:hypothetical protein